VAKRHTRETLCATVARGVAAVKRVEVASFARQFRAYRDEGPTGRTPRRRTKGPDCDPGHIRQFCEAVPSPQRLNSKGDFLWLCFGSAPLSGLLALPRLCSRFPATMLSCWVNSLSRTLEMVSGPTTSGDADILPLIAMRIGNLLRVRGHSVIPSGIGKLLTVDGGRSRTPKLRRQLRVRNRIVRSISKLSVRPSNALAVLSLGLGRVSLFARTLSSKRHLSNHYETNVSPSCTRTPAMSSRRFIALCTFRIGVALQSATRA
jgi:hypothetical protein